MAVPIIGQKQSRGWLSIRVDLFHDDQSHTLPDRTIRLPTQLWVLRYRGTRSDGLKVETAGTLTDVEVRDPALVEKGLFAVGSLFQTYLNCGCRLDGAACLEHQAPQGRVS